MISLHSLLVARPAALTAGAVFLASLFVVLLAIPWESFTIALFFTVLLVSLAAGFAVYYMLKKLSSTIITGLSHISDTLTAVCDGETGKRLDIVQSGNVDEVNHAFWAVNRLTEKAEKDVEEMRRLERVRTEFLANVSHELRTPIFSIQGFLETLLDGAIDDSSVRLKFVEKAYSNTMRLNLLLTDLIDISRMESGAMRLSFRYFPLIPLVREIIDNYEESQGQIKNNVTITSSLPDADISVYGDRDRIAQVLTNLIDNAIKYNVADGSVHVRVAEEGKKAVRLSVDDTGIGIPKEHHQRIFERFYRVDKARSRDVGGTGLGLAIVKHILEAHKSTLTVDSEPGKGTSISFVLQR